MPHHDVVRVPDPEWRGGTIMVNAFHLVQPEDSWERCELPSGVRGSAPAAAAFE